MNHDCYEHVLKYFIRIHEMRNLQFVNKTFNFLVKKRKRELALEFLKDFIKYKASKRIVLKEKMELDRFTSTDLALAKSFWVANYSFDYKNLEKSLVSYGYGKLHETPSGLSSKQKFTYDILTDGDILSDIIIYGDKIKRVEIIDTPQNHEENSARHNQVIIQKFHFIDASMVSVKPLFKGIFLLGCFYPRFRVNVEAEQVKFIYAKMLFLDNNDKNFIFSLIRQQMLSFHYPFYYNKKYKYKIRCCLGFAHTLKEYETEDFRPLEWEN